jgi:hypothetical protein
MNNDSRVNNPVRNSLHDLVEGDGDDGAEIGRKKPEQQMCSGKPARSGDSPALQTGRRDTVAGNDQWPASPSHCSSGPQQNIAVTDMSISVIGDLGYIELLPECQTVKGFHVLQRFPENKSAGIDETMGEGIEEESIVGTG